MATVKIACLNEQLALAIALSTNLHRTDSNWPSPSGGPALLVGARALRSSLHSM
jgi:hypothetical protein